MLVEAKATVNVKGLMLEDLRDAHGPKLCMCMCMWWPVLKLKYYVNAISLAESQRNQDRGCLFHKLRLANSGPSVMQMSQTKTHNLATLVLN